MRRGHALDGRNNPDARKVVAGRILLRALISEELGIPWGELAFMQTPQGKLYLNNASDVYPNFNFNLTHAGDWVCAILCCMLLTVPSNGPLGL